MWFPATNRYFSDIRHEFDSTLAEGGIVHVDSKLPQVGATCTRWLPDAGRPDKETNRHEFDEGWWDFLLSSTAMEQVENYVVSNARIVQTDNQLWDMCNHLSGTVLQYNENLQGDLFKLLTLGMPDRYKAQYCIAKANRFILVKCLACGCGMYGKYGYKDPEDQKETIRVLAAFVNRKLEASAAHL